jgi:hypothetical protein
MCACVCLCVLVCVYLSAAPLYVDFVDSHLPARLLVLHADVQLIIS